MWRRAWSRPFRRQQMFDRGLDLLGIAEQGVAVQIDLLAGFGEGVDAIDLRHLADVVARQHVEHHQGGQALPVRRTFVHLIAAIVRRHRRHVVRVRARKILQRVQAADRAQLGHDVFGNGALVESRSSLFRDRAQRRRKPGVAHARTGDGRLAIDQEGFRSVRVLGRDRHVAVPVPGDAGLHDVAFVRQLDRGRQDFAEAPGAVVFHQLRPGADRAGHHHGMRRMLGDRNVSLAIPCRVRRRRRPAGAVERDRRGAALRRVERKAIAADARHHRIDHALHGDRCDSGIDRVAAGAKHLQRHQRRHRMRRRGRGLRGIDRRAAGEEEIAQGNYPFRKSRGRP